jgi:hypothetical protein
MFMRARRPVALETWQLTCCKRTAIRGVASAASAFARTLVLAMSKELMEGGYFTEAEAEAQAEADVEVYVFVAFRGHQIRDYCIRLSL